MSDSRTNLQGEAKTRLDPAGLTTLGQEELYMLFSVGIWKDLAPESRLALLQEVENRQARLDGRPPLRVVIEKMDGSLMGVHYHEPEYIALNMKFFRVSKLFGGKDEQVFNAAQALNTVLHEGRHAHQVNSVRNGSLNLEYIKEWALNTQEVYIQPVENYLLYSLQTIEMDARRFARRRIREVEETFRRYGVHDPNFSRQVIADKQRECGLIMAVRKYLTLEKLDEIEKELIDRFAKAHPGVDVKGLTLFDSARVILKHPEINSLEEMLDMIDRRADAKMILTDGRKLNLKDSVDDRLHGLAGGKRFS